MASLVEAAELMRGWKLEAAEEREAVRPRAAAMPLPPRIPLRVTFFFGHGCVVLGLCCIDAVLQPSLFLDVQGQTFLREVPAPAPGVRDVHARRQQRAGPLLPLLLASGGRLPRRVVVRNQGEWN